MSESKTEPRRWFIKKRYLIPAGLLGLLMILGAGEGSEVASTEQSAAAIRAVAPVREEAVPEREPEADLVEELSDVMDAVIEEEGQKAVSPPVSSFVTPEPTPAPKPKAVAPEPVRAMPTQSCHPGYSGCLNPNASDYDCEGGSGNGPYYTGPVQVYGSDPFKLDRDGDGWGCE